VAGNNLGIRSLYKFLKHLRDCGVIQSFSNSGTPYDNAVAESFFSIMKRKELFLNYGEIFAKYKKCLYPIHLKSANDFKSITGIRVIDKSSFCPTCIFQLE
jgi:transposase InsO family protein